MYVYTYIYIYIYIHPNGRLSPRLVRDEGVIAIC